MEFLNFILEPKKLLKICFLCLKERENISSIYDLLEIHDEFNKLVVTVYNITIDLIAKHDFLTNQVCNYCSGLLLKLFLLLQRNQKNNLIYHNIITKVNSELTEIPNEEIKMSTSRKINADRKKQENIIKTDMTFDCQLNVITDITIGIKTCKKKKETKPLICEICGVSFLNKKVLNIHLKLHKALCPKCKKTIKVTNYDSHLKSHEYSQREKKSLYICSNCHYSSHSKQSLEAHINKVHLKTRPYKCQECSKGFFKKSNLVEHKLIHSKVRDKICEVCASIFLNEKGLKDHLKLHKGEKSYKCLYCDKHFITSGRRSEHTKIKHMIKTEICEVCSKKFSLKKQLKRHMENHCGFQNQDKSNLEKKSTNVKDNVYIV